MKTNQVLTRKMGQFDVLQRTKDGMFNATTLLKQWNKYAGQNKEVTHFFANNSTKEFIETIQKREFPVPGITSSADYKCVYIKTKGGKDRGATWMHPYLFIDFSMWLNPEFKYDVIRFVYDELIKYRNSAARLFPEDQQKFKSSIPKTNSSKSI